MPGPRPSAHHHDAVAAAHTLEKAERGQFFTMTNPFTHPRFATWLAQIPAGTHLIEPFAGANNLVRMVAPLLDPDTTWHSYDIEPQHPDVQRRDTLHDYPKLPGSAVITNPPYLAKNSARRSGLHAAADLCGPHDNLYKRCLEECLNGSAYVAAIIPESFITSGAFRDRLQAVISLTEVMFVDTEVPVCLALWGATPTDDFELWSPTEHLGSWATLSAAAPADTDATARIKFNVVDGQIGLLATDTPAGATIRFTTPDAVPTESVKHSARLRTRIHVADLDPADVADVIVAANDVLTRMRHDTSDVTLTAFMGLRRDGRYRRRLDFATARRILATALTDADHRHDEAAPAVS